MTDKVYHLSKVDSLAELNMEELKEVASNFFWEECHPKDDIIIQGQEHNRFYVLVAGQVEVLDNQRSGQTRINTFGPGDTFGARSLLTNGPAPFTIRCLNDCKVLVMSADQFSAMLERWPKLYKKFIERLSRNLDQINIGLTEARNKQFLHTLLQNTQYENKFYGLWGGPATTRLMEKKLTELAKSKEHLLLIGERGTGRQMAAWDLHKRRFGEGAPFVVIDALDLEKQWGTLLFEPEMPGDLLPKSGSLLEYVDGGTLVIKEIKKLSSKAQMQLAEAMRTHRNCLVVGFLQKEPEQAAGILAPELLETFADRFAIKPVREHKRDIPFLVQGVLEKLAEQHNRKTPSLDHETTKILLSHNYRQGNVTELIQVIERSFFLAENDVIGLEHVFFGPTAIKLGGTFDLLSFPWLEKIIKEGSFVIWSQRIVAVTFLFIIALLFAVPQAAIDIGLFALVWGLWWPALAIISPFLGRIWCTVCPFGYIMEIVQNKLHLNRPVPDWLKKYNFLVITFLFALIFWLEIVFHMRSNPILTVVLLTTILGAAALTGIIFVRHTWCHHLCPLGGFVGMASIGGILEVRSDPEVCLNKCTTFECYKGTPKIVGCPMSQYAPYLDNNLDCKLCFRCARNCPNGSVKVNLRIPGREVWHLLRVNQGFTVFIGASLAILIPILYFEPLRQVWPMGMWLQWFSISYWGSAVIGGMLSWWIGKPFVQKAASRRIKMVFAFIPAVVAGHIIYQLHFLPGAQSILLGLGIKTAAGDINAVNIPAVKVGQLFAVLIGLALTAFTALMVMLRSKKKSLDKPASPADTKKITV